MDSTQQASKTTIGDSGGLSVDIVAIGASVAAVRVPVAAGPADVVVSGLNAADFANNPNYCGSTIGRFANRIANARFELDGRVHQLEKNDGTKKHSLHSGSGGLHARRFSIIAADASSIELRYHAVDGEEGFPGALEVSVLYRVRGMNLSVELRAETSRATVVNMTNHSYFNLAGDASDSSMLRHELMIAAGRYTPVDEEGIPTGEVSSLQGNRLDLRRPTRIGDVIENGIDDNYVTDPSDRETVPVAVLRSPDSGISMQLFTSMPGLQVYTADHAAAPMQRRAAIALEPQYFPDSPNQAGFPSTVLRPGECWRETIEYRFSVD